MSDRNREKKELLGLITCHFPTHGEKSGRDGVFGCHDVQRPFPLPIPYQARPAIARAASADAYKHIILKRAREGGGGGHERGVHTQLCIYLCKAMN